MFTAVVADVKVIGVHTVMVEIAQWRPGVWVEVPIKHLPLTLQRELEVGLRCRVHVYLNAVRADNLRMHNWMHLPNVPVVQLDRTRRS